MAKKFMVLLVICLFVIQAPLAVSAVTIALDYNIETGVVSVSGQSDTPVTIVVMPKGVSADSMLQSDAKPVYFEIAKPSGTAYTHSFKTAALANGRYEVTAIALDGEDKMGFMKINANVPQLILDAVNSAGEWSSLMSVSETYAADLGVDMEAEGYAANKETTFRILAAVKDTYTNAAGYVSDYNISFALAKVVESGSDGDIALKAASPVFGIDFANEFTNYEGLTDAAKAELIKSFAGYDWITNLSGTENFKADVVSAFYNMRVMSALKTAGTRVQLENVITKYFDEYFPFVESNTKYKNLNNPAKVFERMMGITYSSIADVETEFGRAVDAQYADENKTTIKPSRPSGNSGGLGGIAVPAPVPTPEQNNTGGQSFSDVPTSHWAYNAISELTGRKIINGYGDGSYKPDNTITRAEYTKLILEVCKAVNGKATDESTTVKAAAEFKNVITESVKQTNSSDSISFADVSPTDWFAPYVTKAASLGFVNGSGTGFAPNDNITREDAAVILYRMISRSRQLNGTYNFSDGYDMSSYAVDAINALASKGIISGLGNNMFLPKSNLTRAQAAQLLYNILEHFGR